MTIPRIRLNLVVLRSADIDRAAQFYGTLGLEFTKHRHGTGPEHYACELGDAVFEIYPRQSDRDGTSSIRIGFRVASVEALVAQLQEAGARIVSPPTNSPWGRRAVVADPDGHKVELTQPERAAE